MVIVADLPQSDAWQKPRSAFGARAAGRRQSDPPGLEGIDAPEFVSTGDVPVNPSARPITAGRRDEHDTAWLTG
jgi:hypothetical protein